MPLINPGSHYEDLWTPSDAVQDTLSTRIIRRSLYVVVCILAYVFFIATIAFMKTERDMQRENDIRNLSNAVQAYMLYYRKPPAAIPQITPKAICKHGVLCPNGGIDLSLLMNDRFYLASIPSDPRSAREDWNTQYTIVLMPNGRVRIMAPLSETHEIMIEI